MLEWIYIARHGFRSNWVDPSIKTGPTGMPRDPPLAAYGTSQAVRLASFLSSPASLAPYPVPERVFSSPFYRCIETAVPTGQALRAVGTGGSGVMLEHGVMEWYSPVNPSTGLHPRPSDSHHLSPLFPGAIDESYTTTLFPSRRGESLRDLQDRADLFVEAWTSRVEAMGFRTVVVFAHAASVIALGRALTGDKSLNISAGCASCSLYRRKRPSTSITSSNPSVLIPGVAAIAEEGDLKVNRSTSSLTAASGLLALSRTDDDVATANGPVPEGKSKGGNMVDGPGKVEVEGGVEACGVGEWDAVWLGRADYLEKGVERDWSFRDAVIVNGEVITDDGDHCPHPPEDTIPVGLAPGMERFLRRGRPAANGPVPEAQGTVQGKI